MGPNRGKYPYCNCLYIHDEINALVDTCCGDENLQLIMAKPVDVVINSHFHEDHILNNHRFKETEIWAHPLDAPAISSLPAFLSYYGFTEPDEKRMVANYIEQIDLRPMPVDRFFADQEILDFGTVKLSVIFTPGHTPGHCGFYDEKNGILFSSDIDLTGFGPWYGHSCSNINDFIASINRCMDIEANTIASSHGNIVTENIASSFKKYLDVIFRKEELVRNALLKPSTLDELVEKHFFYGEAINRDPFLRIFEKKAIEQHLRRLLDLREIACNNNIYYIS